MNEWTTIQGLSGTIGIPQLVQTSCNLKKHYALEYSFTGSHSSSHPGPHCSRPIRLVTRRQIRIYSCLLLFEARSLGNLPWVNTALLPLVVSLIYEWNASSYPCRFKLSLYFVMSPPCTAPFLYSAVGGLLDYPFDACTWSAVGRIVIVWFVCCVKEFEIYDVAVWCFKKQFQNNHNHNHRIIEPIKRP